MHHQVSTVAVRNYVSEFEWTFNNFWDYPYMKDNFFISKKIQFKDIDISW